MLRTAAKKVAWVGRTASMVFGLALVLALLFGVASTAWSATGGNFLLGKLNNAATAVTGLVGNVDGGAALRVTNPNAGTNDTALDLRVQAGEAPMKVNSATRVANLNAASAGRADSAASADTATSAQNAANAQNASDADKLDGMDSSEFQRTVAQPGQTLTGVWGVNAGGEGGTSIHYPSTPIEFRPQLPADIPLSNAHYVTGSSAANCSGHGQADPGHLCVYQAVNAGALAFAVFGDPMSGSGGVRAQGTILYLQTSLSTPSTSYARGTWAVTVPQAAQQSQQEVQGQTSGQSESVPGDAQAQ